MKPLLALMESMEVKGLVHITGGGLVENIPRVLADNLTAELDSKSWTMPPLFQWLQQHGGVADAEMHRVFNCGIGMTVIVSAANADAAVAQLTAAGGNRFPHRRDPRPRRRRESDHRQVIQHPRREPSGCHDVAATSFLSWVLGSLRRFSA
ncbi:AIR synthase-related protein [Pseudoduganella sp. UC29_106]|uniref:AIR synthase-related protein n=1 Tax=Pseudoduganella sp. UC29_106 TaxID=3374553 RepID=UPI0037564319